MSTIKNKLFFFFSSAAFLLALALGVASCVEETFDEPPTDCILTDVKANTSIKALKAKHTIGQIETLRDDIIIGGEVVMDDRSGNFYKTLVIQDTSGALEIKFNDGFLYSQYPVGRTIYIRCKDLLLTDYNELVQLNGSQVQEGGELRTIGLTESQVRQKLVKGCIADKPVAPKTVAIGGLNKNLLSTLIRLENVQFITPDTAKTYADPVTQNSLNRKLEDCGGKQLLVRTSGFANFAGNKTPVKRGTVVGTLGIFGGEYQLYIRDLNDVKMDSTRCGAGPATAIDISGVRALFTGAATAAPNGRKIKGVVISDRNGKNLNGRNLYIQDGTAGIVVRFAADHSFNLNDEIEINIGGQEISEFNKLMQLNNVPIANAKLLRAGAVAAPREVTVAQLNDNNNFNAWESTLVRIKDASVTGGATLSGSRTVNDGTGTIVMFTQATASFSATATPAAKVTVTAIVSDFNGKQIILRNAGDLQ
jgi:Family of unknown function (DUF5689)